MLLKCRRNINKGIGVDNMHYLNDGLWKVLFFISLSNFAYPSATKGAYFLDYGRLFLQ